MAWPDDDYEYDRLYDTGGVVTGRGAGGGVSDPTASLASFLLPLVATAASFIRPAAAYPLMQMAQMYQTGEERAARGQERAAERAREAAANAAGAKYIKERYGVDIPSQLPVSQQGSFLTAEMAQQTRDRAEGELQRQRAQAGQLGQIRSQIYQGTPEELEQRLASINVAELTPQAWAQYNKLDEALENWKTGRTQAQAFQQKLPQERNIEMFGLPPVPEFAEQVESSLRKATGELPPAPPMSPVEYRTLMSQQPGKADVREGLRLMERGKKVTPEEWVSTYGVPAANVYSPKELAEQQTAQAQLEKIQRENREGKVPSEWASRLQAAGGDVDKALRLGREPKAISEWESLLAAAGGNVEKALDMKRRGSGEGGVAKLSDIQAIRSQFVTQSNEYKTVAAGFQNVQTFAKDPSAAGDMGLIYNYMKMLDPGSVVREGEYANAQNATGVPDIVRNAYNRVVSGQRMNPEQRTDFSRRAGDVYDNALRRQDRLEKETARFSSELGIKPSTVVIDYIGPDRERLQPKKPEGAAGTPAGMPATPGLPPTPGQAPKTINAIRTSDNKPVKIILQPGESLPPGYKER